MVVSTSIATGTSVKVLSPFRPSLPRSLPREVSYPERAFCFMSMVGKEVEFQDEGTGVITGETVDQIYIVSEFFTGWMYKAEFFDLLGIED